MEKLKDVFKIYNSDYERFNELSTKFLSIMARHCTEISFVRLDNNDVYYAALIKEFGLTTVRAGLIAQKEILIDSLMDEYISKVYNVYDIHDWLRFVIAGICEKGRGISELFPFSSADVTIERLLLFNRIWFESTGDLIEDKYQGKYFDNYDEEDYY